MSPVPVSADRRFHRAHVKPAKRRRKLVRLALPAAKYGALVLGVMLALYAGRTVLADAPVLKINDIVVRGNRQLPTGDVLSALSGLRGENIVSSDLSVWRDHLMTSPWVGDATLRRSLPSTIEVLVSEREPLGIGRVRGRLYLVDDHGGIIDEYGPKYADFDLPLIDGLESASGSATPTDPERGELAARVVQALRGTPEIARRLSQVDVTDVHNASVILDGDRAVLHVGDDRFLPRIESYLELATALRQRVSEIDYVDLRFEDRIYVRPVEKSGASTQAAAARRSAANSSAPSKTGTRRQSGT